MHKCKICGEEFENTGLLLQHYKKHKREEEEKGTEEKGTEEKGISIPIDCCPKETALLGENQTVCLKILGMKKGSEIIINDVYLL